MSTRLIERHLPIAALSEESTRERRRPTSLPPINFLHVWWARRPLIASRAAILASVLPADADRNAFLRAIGIHGDPVATQTRLAIAKRTKTDLGTDPYGYPRAFTYSPASEVERSFGNLSNLLVVDPTAGGGSIPFEAMRLGMAVEANDLNPVAALVLKGTIEYPKAFGRTVLSEFNALADRFAQKVEAKTSGLYPAEDQSAKVDGYLWARTIACPYCAGIIPLSPNWRLSPDGSGVKLVAHTGEGPGDASRRCTSEIVPDLKSHSEGTVASGNAVCPFPDCGRAIDGSTIKEEAQAGRLGEQLFAIATKRQVPAGTTKSGKKKFKWQRLFRAPNKEDMDASRLMQVLADKQLEWDMLDLTPNEKIDAGNKTDEPLRYGMKSWRDLFSTRQLLAHGMSSEAYRELLHEDNLTGHLTDVRKAAYVYLAFSMDKLLNYNSRMSIWMSTREVIANTFNRHDFAFCWSYAEMPHTHIGSGLEWSLEQVRDALGKIIDLVHGKSEGKLLNFDGSAQSASPVIRCGSGSDMRGLKDGSVDAVVMDPPYGANVMYAELSDFFYVWLKRTAGLVVPELFTRRLADKETEAVANKAHFKGQKGAEKLANRDYQDKMAGIFAECRRVLKDDGIMTVMFTHKDTGAWDALAMSLLDAGFVITASWPVNTEAESSLHIKDKAAANSTIFLVCRPRLEQGSETSYWEEVEPLVAKAVRERIDEFQASGIAGVDLYLASFGPALEAFSRHWPLTRGTPAPQPPAKRGSQGDLLEEHDPYAVRPEDALNAARREVKAWRLAQLADRRASRDMDPPTAWVALAWDAFRAPQFAYDEGLRLARAVGLDMTQVVGRLAEKKGSDLKLWDSATRVAKGALGPANGSRGMIDALHHAANTARKQSVEAARDQLEANGLLNDDEFKVALEVMLEVLPPSKTFSGIDADDAVKPAADDFDALEKLRRIVYGEEIGAPKQLSLYEQLEAAE